MRPKRRGQDAMVRTMLFFATTLIAVSGGEAAVNNPTTPHIGVADPGDSSDADLTRKAVPDIEPDAVIIMKEKSFDVVKGGKVREKVTDPHFTLMAGDYIWILLRNEGKLAHEFVSPLFRKVDLEFRGKGSIIYTHTAAGVRVEPGQVVAIRFWLPERFYDLFYFWCNVHGKIHGDEMRGEIFILESTDQTE